MPSAASLFRWLLAVSIISSTVVAQDDTDEVASDTASTAESSSDDSSDVIEWDRLIYVPFKELQKVFDNQNASAVIPYAEYLELLKNYLDRAPNAAASPDAVITQSTYAGAVEKDVVRLTATLKVTVLKEKGWARLPLNFGSAAVGKITADDDEKVFLRGIADGQYELLLNGPGQYSLDIELLATVKTSPESRSFALNCPSVGISELELTIPEPDQSIEIAPLQVLLPTDNENQQQTTVKASLGATKHFEVRWNPKAGSKPIMDLLASVANNTSVRIEKGLVQTTTLLNYEVLRGELTEVTVNVPADARIIDVVSTNGRIRNWNAEKIGETHQQLRIELLTPATGQFQVGVQTERTPDGDTLQLVGKSEDGKLQGIHAEGVVRESGRISVTTDSSLTTVVTSQSGVKRIDAARATKGAAAEQQAWEFSGTTGTLIVQTKPVEPRLLVEQGTRVVFDDDELRLTSQLTYTVERAGVFQLNLSYPESLTIDTVRADGMSEFNVDKATGKLTLSLTQKRMGKINVDITAHQAFDAAADNVETEIPTITPLNVERESGQIGIFAPQFLDAVTVDEKVTGVFPGQATDPQAIGRAIRVSSWKYTQRPFTLTVRTSPRPAQLSGSVATTASVEPDVVKVSSVVKFDVRNAGLDTYRVAVPEAVADDVRFRSLNPNHTIQQRDKATEAEDGWVTWTLVLQNEVTGEVQVAADWELPLQDMLDEDAEQTFELQPVRILTPFTDEQGDKRKVTLTQTRGEMRLLRHESLSITATGAGDTIEKIDVRELELMEQSGYLAFRYFSQPASATVTIRKHEIHEVVATVVSKSAIEIVTDEQTIASYRCRFMITTSERQRLRIDLPQGADLQAPLLNSSRTTFEAATDAEVEEGREAYYVNISREATSDEAFLLTVQFRCPITDADLYPYDRRGGKQVLRLPAIGDSSGGTVVQETRVAVWGPKDVAFVGEPNNWSIIGRQQWQLLNPLVSPSAPREAEALNTWIGGGTTGEFARQGNVSVYRALGRQSVIRITWWNRPFLVAIISGALLFIGFILRRTSWENRITMVIIGCLAVAVWSLKDSSETLQFLSAGSLGLVAVAGIWLAGLFGGNSHNRDHASPAAEPDASGAATVAAATSPAPVMSPPNPAPTATKPTEADASASPPTPPGTVTPSPDVKKMIDDLMGGKS
ncbi:hypothetical protein [Fuerstiella marisgermanici]|uniref:Uncharacterized protein n=1 Tax=Fuerstiella marisgermanici TaxID=1891926 RepID=A0A1P8WD63_9PLAN|nr:hypothetical protein [Fuerstiella marisgermanici]APZ92018.1 hypothetical protein Fuma_01619 [Fuerstiella marisgermanici]